MLEKLRDDLKRRVKWAIASVHARRRVAHLERTERHIEQNELVAGLRALGIEEGDTLFVHSSLKSLGYVTGGPSAVIASLRQAVGSTGNVLLPTYYLPGGTILATCEMTDYVFDKRVHGTNMGALPSEFLATPGVCRSIHPTHSVSALGPNARWLTEAHHLAPSVFGEGSPWQRFVNTRHAKVLGLGISMGPVTFYHLLEDTMGDRFPVQVWQERAHQMPCIDDTGRPCLVPVRAYDPVVSARRIDQKSREDLRDYFSREFDRARLKRSAVVGQARSWVIPGREFLDHLAALANEGITIYSTADQLAARPVS